MGPGQQSGGRGVGGGSGVGGGAGGVNAGAPSSAAASAAAAAAAAAGSGGVIVPGMLAGEVNYNKVITKKLASATAFHQVRD